MNCFHIVKMCELRAKEGNIPAGKENLSFEIKLTLFNNKIGNFATISQKNELQAHKIKL